MKAKQAEAMATGLPVVATAVGDLAAMLPAEGQPYLTALDDVALSAALAAVLADAALRTRLGAANRARAVAVYDQQVMFNAWGRLFNGQP